VGTITTNTISTGYEMRDLDHGIANYFNYTTNVNGRTDILIFLASSTIFKGPDNGWGNGSRSSVETDAADAHLGAALTYDFYKLHLGRNGIWNNGRGSISRVNYGSNYNNAFWSSRVKGMTYGRGDNSAYSALTTLDVCGHEMAHGVTAATANLTYSGESGGLNESISDCMGASVEQWAVGQGRAAAPAGNLFNYWQIGEQCKTPATPGDALRYMSNPRQDGLSPNYWYSGIGSVDVHYSSGVGNLAFYLAAAGGENPYPRVGTAGTGANYRPNDGVANPVVQQIGYLNASRIWYRALSVYMTSSTTYAQARVATLNAARDLFGLGSTQYTAVAAAWTNVNVN